MIDIANYIDHTILKPTTKPDDIVRLCAEAKEYGFAAVCVPPYYVAAASNILQGSGVHIATVIGFPFGYSTTAAKLAEISAAISAGATELDVVHNLAALKSGDWQYLQQEVKACTDLAHSHGCIIKVIIESGVLTDDEIIKCCEVYSAAGVDFMKTSTGYAETGATTHAVQLMRKHLRAEIAIKASGGIRTFAFTQELIHAGATRIGTSSGIAIVKESKEP